MKSTNVILYHGGVYGTFIEWIVNFLKGTTDTYPFRNDGSSHNFHGNLLSPNEKIFEYLKSEQTFEFIRVHPGIFDNKNSLQKEAFTNYIDYLQKDIDFLKNNFTKVLILYWTSESTLWVENNMLDKAFISDERFEKNFKPYNYDKKSIQYMMEKDPIKRIRGILQDYTRFEFSNFTTDNFLSWGKNRSNDLDVWELRELLSLCWFSRPENQIIGWNNLVQNNPDILSINIKDIRDYFVPTILKISTYFGVPTDSKSIMGLREIEVKWKNTQKSLDRDTVCLKIAQSIIKNEFYDWSNYQLSIIDEAWIQKFLRDNSIEIRCYGLNLFPTNSKVFQEFLEKNSYFKKEVK